jgi:DNA-binding transcriptional LysR family regulator
MRNIDIVLLRSFVAVAETGRMTTAAKVVNVSQSAISQQIKRLETLFGVELFDRQVDAARLTREGEKLMSHAHRLISLNDDVVGQMQGRDFSGEVKLGVPHDIVGMLMPPILRIFRQAHPNVLITLVSDATRTLRALLSQRAIDLCLTTEVERGSRDQYLMTDRLVWVGAKGGDACRRRPLSVALGQESCGFRASAVKALNGARIEWRPICQVGSLEPVFATLEADMAIAPFLSRTVPDRLVSLNDTELPPLPDFHINLRLPARPHTPIAAELARHIKAGFQKRYA